MRLIDADALKKEVNKKKVVGRFNTLLLIDNAPTVKAYTPKQVKEIVDLSKKMSEERPKGEWAEFEGGYRCSNCDDIEAYTPNYCPNCGAKMDGGAE